MSQPSFLYDSGRFVFSTYIINMIRNLIKFLFYIIYSVISTYLISIHPKLRTAFINALIIFFLWIYSKPIWLHVLLIMHLVQMLFHRRIDASFSKEKCFCFCIDHFQSSGVCTKIDKRMCLPVYFWLNNANILKTNYLNNFFIFNRISN